MIVFVAGMSRAGSMWTYNVTRVLLKNEKTTVLPVKISVDERPIINEALRSKETDNEVYCIKTHYRLNNPLPTSHKVKVISNIRDVRDAFLSYMRFMHTNFENGIKTMQEMMVITDYYVNAFAGNLLIVHYERIENNAMDILSDICDYLEIFVSEGKRRDVVEQFSKSTIRKQISNLSDIKVDSNGLIEDKELAEIFVTVPNFDGTYRVLDKNTTFQTNHITSSKDGEWREYFNDSQISQIQNISSTWLKNHGFRV